MALNMLRAQSPVCTGQYRTPSRAMKISPFLVRAAIAFASVSCFAQVEAKFNSTFDKCMENSAAINPRMIECYGAEIELQDKRLNEVCRKLLVKLEPERQKVLIAVQRQWLRYTEAKCAFYYDPNGGTAARMAAD